MLKNSSSKQLFPRKRDELKKELMGEEGRSRLMGEEGRSQYQQSSVEEENWDYELIKGEDEYFVI